MKKQLTSNQQDIINTITAEFLKENEISKGVNSNDVLKFINASLNVINKEKIEAEKHNTLEEKRAEVFLNDVLSKMQPILNKFNIETSKSYIGSGAEKSIYLQIETKGTSPFGGDGNSTHTLYLKSIYKILDETTKYKKFSFTGVKVGYPTYKDTSCEKNNETIIQSVAEWIIHCKEKEIRVNKLVCS